MKHSQISQDPCKCRYCLAQILKGRRNPSEQSILYCPKLFFSTDERKISTSIADLFENPSNQFRLFVNAVKISSEKMWYFIIFVNFILIFSNFKVELNSLITKIVINDQFFQNFIQFQIELLDGIVLDSINFDAINFSMYECDIKNLATIQSVCEIPDYLRILMAMSVRDSSFVISIIPNFKRPKWKPLIYKELLYYYKVDIIDLDIKPFERISKYIEEIKIHG